MVLESTCSAPWVRSILPNQPVRNQWNYQEKMQWYSYYLGKLSVGKALILGPRGSTVIRGQVRMATNRGQPAVLIVGSFLGIFNS